MDSGEINSIEVLIVAVPETSGSALYGMLNVLLLHCVFDGGSGVDRDIRGT